MSKAKKCRKLKNVESSKMSIAQKCLNLIKNVWDIVPKSVWDNCKQNYINDKLQAAIFKTCHETHPNLFNKLICLLSKRFL